MTRDPAHDLIPELRWLQRLAAAVAGGDAELADDLVQDGALALLQQRTAPRSLRAWLATVVRRRAAGVRGRGMEALTGEPTAGSEPVEVAARLEAQQHLNAAVLALPEPYRSVVVQHHLDGIPLAELARRHGVAPAAVWQRHKRALAMLRDSLDRDRGDWRTALAPLLGVHGLEGSVVGTSVVGGAGAALAAAGGVVMMKKLLAAAAVVLAVAVIGSSWWRRQAVDDVPAGAADGPPAPSAAGARATGDGTETAARAPGPDLGSRRTEVVASAGGRTDRLRVVVRSETGSPVAGAVVYHGPLEEAPRWGRTDRTGVLEAPARSGSGAVWVWAEGRAPHGRAVSALHGDVEVVMPGRPTVSGLVLVDGSPPGRDLPFLVTLTEPTGPGPLPEAWTRGGTGHEEVRSFLQMGHAPSDETMESWRRQIAFSCAPDGRFELQGVDRGQLGELFTGTRVPLVFANTADLRDGELPSEPARFGTAPLDLRTLTGPLVVHLRQHTAVQARLVYPDGEPVAFARVTLRTWHADGWPGGTSQKRSTDGEGRLFLPLQHSVHEHRFREASAREKVQQRVHWTAHGTDLDRLSLVVDVPEASPEPRTWERADLLPRTHGKRIDLGEVVVERNHPLDVRVTDREGAPIEGAFVLGKADLFGPTDVDGRIRVWWHEPRPLALWIGAPGRQVARVQPSAGVGSEADPLRLVLDRRANHLRFRIPRERVPADAQLQLRLVSDRPIYPGSDHPADGADLPSDLHEIAAGEHRLGGWSARSDGRRSVFTLSPSDDLTWDLVSVVPGVAVDVTVQDRFGTALVSRHVVTPEAGEIRTVTLEPAGGIFRHRVRVLADGRPVAGARVVWRSVDGAHCRKVTTDADGRAELSLAASGAVVQLVAGAEGMATHVEPVRLTGEGTETVLTMWPAASLEVRLVDDDGEPVDGVARYAPEGSLPLGSPEHDRMLPTNQPERLGTGRWRIRDAPSGAVPLLLLVAGQWSAHDVVPVDGIVRLVVPSPVPVRLAMPRGEVGQAFDLVALSESGRPRASWDLMWTRGGWQPGELALVPGTYRIELREPGWDTALVARELVVGDAPTVLRIQPPQIDMRPR